MSAQSGRSMSNLLAQHAELDDFSLGKLMNLNLGLSCSPDAPHPSGVPAPVIFSSFGYISRPLHIYTKYGVAFGSIEPVLFVTYLLSVLVETARNTCMATHPTRTPMWPCRK